MEPGKPHGTTDSAVSATDSALIDFDAVCQKVRASIEPARAYAVSLHDERGEVLWLSESSMGPDEHNAIREAVAAFRRPESPPVLVHDLGDSRSAVLLRVMNTRRAMVGAIMIVVDTRVVKQDGPGTLKMMTPKLMRALSDFATMRPRIEPAPPAPARPATVTPLTLVSASAPRPAARTAPARPSAAAAAAATRSAPQAGSASQSRSAAQTGSAPQSRSAPQPRPASQTRPAAPSQAARSPNPTPKPAPDAEARVAAQSGVNERPRSPPEIDRFHSALRRSPIALHVQRLVPLSKGSQLKRYEVLLRSRSETEPSAAPQALLKAAVDNGLGSMIDRRVVSELMGFLVRHPDVWKSTAVMFSVNLTTTALHDEHFIKFVGLCLAKSKLPRGMIAFEVDTATAVKFADSMEDVCASLHRLGCPVVLDDFALKTECFDLLRLPGVHYVKLAPQITKKMRTDKLSQAAITAVVQMARVLGMHTVAKRAESAAEQEWLTALGVDFVQANSSSPPKSIESLSRTPSPPRTPAPA